MQQEEPASFQKLEEELLCSVCCSELNDPVSIACGHTFCRECITNYWDTSQQMRCLCPECRKVCPKDQLIPVHRLRNLVARVQLEAKEEKAKKESPVCAIQLVRTDEFGHLQVDEAAIHRCFMNSNIMDYPVCLICVIGEKQQSKSSLINCILRTLSCQEKGQLINPGSHNEPISRFEWRAGITSMAKGIWIWSKPFILDHCGEKMAVFVLDTEDSLEFESLGDTGIRLSAISAALSSYRIFIVDSVLKTTVLDYFEMYFHVAKCVGTSFELEPLQHLDILRPSRKDVKVCGKEDLWSYIIHETKYNPSLYKLVLETLKEPLADCSYLPHKGRRRKLSVNMEDDFKHLFEIYIFNLVRDIHLHIKMDNKGEKVTCGQLAGIVKSAVNVLQRTEYSFASPFQMFFAFENHKNVLKLKERFHNFIHTMSKEANSLIKNMDESLSLMETKINKTATKIQLDFKETCVGDDANENKRLEKELECYLLKCQQEFFTEHLKSLHRFQNHKRMENIREKFLKVIFTKSEERYHLIKVQNLRPARMESNISDTATNFLSEFKESFKGDDTQENEILENELESFMFEQQKELCKMYSKNFYAFQNKKLKVNIKRTFHRKIKHKKVSEPISLIGNNTHPIIIENDLNNKVDELLFVYKESLEGIDDQQKRQRVHTMKESFMQEKKRFCEEYRKKFHVYENQKIMEKTKIAFQKLLEKMESETVSLIRKNEHPDIIEKRMRNKVYELLAIYRQSLEGIDEQQKQCRVYEIQTGFRQEKDVFCNKYRKKFYAFKNQETMEKTMQTFRTFLYEMEEETSTLLANLMVTPFKMKDKISDAVDNYNIEFTNSLEGTDNQEKEILADRMDLYFTQEQEAFCKEYFNNYHSKFWWILSNGEVNSEAVVCGILCGFLVFVAIVVAILAVMLR
ncbi:hypothetical protein XELAEV_18001592mg [Xenopus laevis]|nr:hypothetical protein XELAEV_18001592mg [Xenopus laevis]